MKNKIIGFLMVFVLGIVYPIIAQQPQAQLGQPIFSANSKYTNGVAPGYWPTYNLAHPDLTLNLSAGTSNCGGTDVFYAGGTLTMPVSSTVYIDLSVSNCVPEMSVVGYQSNMHLATVVTNGSVITGITDTRTMFFRGGGPTGGGQNYFNILLYGSVCDGTVRIPDDGPGMTAAASAAALAGPNSVVLIPAGSNCIVNSHPSFSESGLNLWAYGAQITSTNADYILQFTGRTQSVHGLLFVDDTPAVTNENAIQLVAVNGFFIEDSGIITNSPVNIFTDPHTSGMGLVYTNRVAFTQD